MAALRDARGRFAAKPPEDQSPAYRRRIESATARGKSSTAARGHGTMPRRMWETAGLQGNPKYDASIEVLRRTRHGVSLSKASKEFGIAPDTVLRYAGAAFERDRLGRWKPKPNDRLFRRMQFLDARGRLWVEPANFKEARKLAAYQNAVRDYIYDEDDRALRKFKHMRLKTRQKTSLPFVTDLDVLNRLGDAQELSFEYLYEH